jgi:hypothetical protein
MAHFLTPNLNKLASTEKDVPAPSSSAPRMNVISALLMLGPIGLGVLLSALTLNPFAAIVGTLLGVVAVAANR